MNCISFGHACFYGGLVDTYKIPNIQNVVYSDKYQSTEKNNNCLKRKEECLFSLAYARKMRKWGCLVPQREGILVCFTKFILNFRLQVPFQIHRSPFSMSFI